MISKKTTGIIRENTGEKNSGGDRKKMNMGNIEQGRNTRIRKKRRKRHRRSMLLISSVVMLLLIVMSVNVVSLKQRSTVYEEQEAELKAQLKEEKERTSELEDLESYVGTDAYIEKVAREKLGLAYKDELLFRAEN